MYKYYIYINIIINIKYYINIIHKYVMYVIYTNIIYIKHIYYILNIYDSLV